MRVLAICDGFFRYAVPQLAPLTDLGAEVKILCRWQLFEFRGLAAEREAVVTAAETAGIEVLQFPYEIRDVRALPVLRRHLKRLRRWDPDVTHTQENGDPRTLLAPNRPTVL